jgi:outer membrane protein assembly factor BamE (lipoprotein component of BamABCDE complex)
MLHRLGRGTTVLLLVLAPLGVLSAGGLWFSEGPGASLSALSRIRPAMTRDQVVELLGRPGTINRSEDGSESWFYTRGTFCQVKVFLTPEGLVSGTDHDH